MWPHLRPFGAHGSPSLLIAGAFLGLAGAILGIVFSAQILAGLWDGKAPAASPSAASPTSGQGRQLTAERANTSQWQAIAWAGQGIRLQVPPGWRETERSSQELVYQSPEPQSITLRWRVIPMPAITPVESMRAGLASKAHDDLAGGYIEGYEPRKLGGVPGVLTIQQRRDGAFRFVVWEGYVGRPQEIRDVTLVLTPGPGQFEGSQAVLGAILDSVRLD